MADAVGGGKLLVEHAGIQMYVTMCGALALLAKINEDDSASLRRGLDAIRDAVTHENALRARLDVCEATYREADACAAGAVARGCDLDERMSLEVACDKAREAHDWARLLHCMAEARMEAEKGHVANWLCGDAFLTFDSQLRAADMSDDEACSTVNTFREVFLSDVEDAMMAKDGTAPVLESCSSQALSELRRYVSQCV